MAFSGLSILRSQSNTSLLVRKSRCVQCAVISRKIPVIGESRLALGCHRRHFSGAAYRRHTISLVVCRKKLSLYRVVARRRG